MSLSCALGVALGRRAENAFLKAICRLRIYINVPKNTDLMCENEPIIGIPSHGGVPLCGSLPRNDSLLGGTLPRGGSLPGSLEVRAPVEEVHDGVLHAQGNVLERLEVLGQV